MSLLALVVVLILLILFSGFFSSSETGMMSLNRYRLRHKAREGHRAAQRVQKLLERPDRLLGVILIGNTFANILASSIATVIAVRLFGEAGILIATILLTLVILIFAEIAPKTVAAIYPQQLAFIVSFPLKVLLKLLYPIVWLATTVANSLLALFGIKVKRKRIAEQLNKEELKTVVHESIVTVTENDAQSSHKDMLLSVLDLENITVDDVMIPRSEVIGIDLNQSIEKIVRQLIGSPHAHLPIYYGSVEKVIGIFYLQDALKLISKNRLTKKSMIKAARPPYFIPESTSLNTQLQKFRDNETHLAIVVDEYGDILGLVTVKDILEEIVGELDSNVRTIQQSVYPDEQGNGYIVSGSVYLRELNKYLGWELPVDGPKTLNGLIVEQLETIPENKVCLLVGNYRIEVLQLKGNKVFKARLLQVKPS